MTVTIHGTDGIDKVVDGSITAEDLAPGVGGSTTTIPTFHVYRNNANSGLVSTTPTKVPFDTEVFDTDSYYDSVTNYRFLPTTAGYYQIQSTVGISGINLTTATVAIYKNGALYKMGEYTNLPTGTSNTVVSVTDVVHFNGSTDYVEIYATGSTSSGNWQINGVVSVASTYFSGFLVRAD